MLDPYRAERLPGGAVVPQWITQGARFWYRVGGRFLVVDPAAGTRRAAFDQERLAAALSTAAGHPVEAGDLPITLVEFGPPERETGTVRFCAFEARWEWSDRSSGCRRVDGDEPPGPGEIVSPDRAWVAFRRDGDVWVRSRDGSQEFALTDDAEPDVDYGRPPDPLGLGDLTRSLGSPPVFLASWSPDSTRLLVRRLDQRGPTGPGQPSMSWTVLDVTTGEVVRQKGEPIPLLHPAACTDSWWSGTKGDAVHLLRRSDDARILELVRLDPDTGATTTLISETVPTGVDPGPPPGDPSMVHVLDSGEILWWSRRDGHLHLHDGDGDGDGGSIRVTTGPGRVRRILWVDEERRQVWFVAAGLVEHDPHIRQVGRIGLDGTGFTRLTDDDLDHDAISPPAGGYLLDRASDLRTPPRSAVLGADGEVLVELEAPDTAELEAVGWAPPERFRATAADGTTPIHGLLWRPHGVDPGGRHPVIVHTGPGPQIHRAGPGFTTEHAGEVEALAALGFAVVAVDGRGTAGGGPASHDHLGSNGAFDDHLAAIRELGHRYSWLDAERVGITGPSAGGFGTARALLAHPDLHHPDLRRLGVAGSADPDDVLDVPMWAEWYHETTTALLDPASAANLRGNLLRIHSGLDDGPAARSLRLIDALIQADSNGDVLLVPEAEHLLFGHRLHVTRRTWDYFVAHLHGTEPPTHRLAPLPSLAA